jgi:hypothetical protein
MYGFLKTHKEEQGMWLNDRLLETLGLIPSTAKKKKKSK